jgi:hypothetical protein
MALGGEENAREECEEVRKRNKGTPIRIRTIATAISPLIIFDDSSLC